MKHSLTYLLCVLALVFAGCAKDDVSFTYSPEAPRAGQSVTFTNNTSEGEEWKWDFGDGYTSSSKSPVKVFKKPGTYTVVLKVDDKASRTCSQTITVYDTVPAIGLSDSTVYYYQPVTLTAEAYNPYSYDMSYEWELPEGTIVIDGDSADKSITVCFTTVEKYAEVKCQMTQGDKAYALDTSIYVYDTYAPAVILGTPGGIFRQRIYDYGFEGVTDYLVDDNMALNPSYISEMDGNIFVFNNSQTQYVGITRFNPSTDIYTSFINNQSAGEGQGMEKGYRSGDMLYWVTGDYIYKTSALGEARYFNAGASSNMLVTSIPEIGYGLASGLKAGGIAYYNGTYMLAYGQGIWRFTPDEIGKSPAEGAILSDYTITDFTIDPIAQKIYFCTSDGLFISNFDGSNVVLIDAAGNGKGIAVDNADNLLFWNTDEGVWCMQLIQTRNNNVTEDSKLQQINTLTNVTSIGIDTQARSLIFEVESNE